MQVYQCDNCKEIIGRGELVIIGRDPYRDNIELCQECAAPIIASVKKSGIGCSLKNKINMRPGKYNAAGERVEA